MLKKLGVRWLPGLPFLTEPKVNHAFHRNEEGLGIAGPTLDISRSKEMALVLVLAQDSNVQIDKGRWFFSMHFLILCLHDLWFH